MRGWQLKVIAQTKEKFMSKTIVDKTKEGKPVFFDIRFMDSFQFMASSLANLVKNLESLTLTQNIKYEYPNLSDELIQRKGVFPYSYFSSLDKLNETSLPPVDEFTNDLTGEACSPEEYQHAQRAWTEFNCKTFNDYMLAYLKLDVYLLADVFETFRRVTLEQDQLDPVHFISLPAMSYSSAFKMTKESIHLLQDSEMYNLFERGIRGGLTFVNKHVLKHKTQGDSTVHLKYIDQNNLYGSALSKSLLHS